MNVSGCLDQADSISSEVSTDMLGHEGSEVTEQWGFAVDHRDLDSLRRTGAGHFEAEEARAHDDRRSGALDTPTDQAGILECSQDQLSGLGRPGQSASVCPGRDEQRIVGDEPSVGRGHDSRRGVESHGSGSDVRQVEVSVRVDELHLARRVPQHFLRQGRSGVRAVGLSSDHGQAACVATVAQFPRSGQAGDRLADDDDGIGAFHGISRKAATGHEAMAARARDNSSDPTSAPSAW